MGFGWSPGASLEGSNLHNLKIIFQGKDSDRFLIDDFSVSAGGKTIYQEKFEASAGKFLNGELVAGGSGGSKAYSFGPKGCWIWDAFATPADDTATLHFKLKPLGDAGQGKPDRMV